MITDRPAHVKKLSANPDYQKHILHFRGAGILALNTARPPFDDVRVRRAIAHAWDQKKYIRASYQDITPYTENWFGNALGCSDTGYLQHDLAKARALMAEVGKPVEFEYVHTATNRGREAGIILQQMMKEIGIKVNPVPRGVGVDIGKAVELINSGRDGQNGNIDKRAQRVELGIAYFYAERFDAAIETFDRMSEQNNDTLTYLAASYGILGKLEEAATCLQELFRANPRYSLNRIPETYGYLPEKDLRNMLDGLGVAFKASTDQTVVPIER